MIDGLDLYSIPGKRWLRTHEFRTTARGPSKSRLHSVSYLNARTVVSGHTQSFIVVVRDTHRAGPAKFQQFFVPLNAEIDRGWSIPLLPVLYLTQRSHSYTYCRSCSKFSLFSIQ